nr:hypothetical protein [Actinoplanes ianthinogenes]
MLLAPAAEVVEVQVAGVALAPHDHEAALASVTPDDALEVMVMGALADATGSAGLQHVLHPVEDLGLDQRFVPALVLDSAVGDVSEVVPVAEQVAERVQRDRGTGREALGRLRAKAGVAQGRDQGMESIRSGGVQLERHPDQRAAHRVDGDRTHLASLERLPDVEVADRGAANRSTPDDFLTHLVRDVRSRRAGLILVDPVEHRGDEVADRRVLGVVHDRDQRGTGVAKVPLGDRRVDAVAVQPGPRVDEHVVHVLLGLESGHHLLEDRSAVHRRRGAAGLDELGDDLGVQLGGAALDGRALGGQRNALGVVVGIDLPGRRDAQVAECAFGRARRPVVLARNLRHLGSSSVAGDLLDDRDEHSREDLGIDADLTYGPTSALPAGLALVHPSAVRPRL